jgi:MFS family permease
MLTNPFALLALRILDGLGAAALWPSAFSMIGDHVPAEKRATAMSQFNLAYLFGLALGPAIGGLINDAAHNFFHIPLAESKQASFYVAALLFAMTTALAVIYLPNVRVTHHDPADLGPGVEGGFNFHDFKQMLGRMPAMLLFAFVTFFGVGLIMAYTKIFVLQNFHLSESRFGLIMLGPALVIGMLSVWLGRLTDRLGKARAVRGGISICALAYWLLLVFPYEWSLVAFGSFIGLGFVVAFPAWISQVSEECEPKLRGAAVGAVGTAQGMGALIGASLSAFLYKLPPVPLGPITIPEHGMPFVACGVMLALAAILALTTIHEPASCEIEENMSPV